MTELERKISETMANLVPRLNDQQKLGLLAYAEGMAAMADAMAQTRADRPA